MGVEQKKRRFVMKKQTIVILFGLLFLATVIVNAAWNYNFDEVEKPPSHMGHVYEHLK